MYCRKCGNLLKDSENFCTSCGEPISNEVFAENRFNNVNSSDSKKSRNVAIAIAIAVGVGIFIVLAIVCFIIFVFSFVFGILSDVEESEYVNIGDVNVTSIFEVVDDISLCGYYSYDNGYEFVLCEELEFDYINEYFSYLIDNEGFFKYDLYSIYKEIGSQIIIISANYEEDAIDFYIIDNYGNDYNNDYGKDNYGNDSEYVWKEDYV